ncbi:MAG: FAD:protein FMN transferase [Verrucomicrobia bacterium]|nr:FAD:protein FMN transferase [Verrucomicrobiota bacterium]
MSFVASPILCRRPAMNTWFEIVLPGDDAENLQAAGEAALDEIERIEKLLSRFDPASEVSRINRDAAISPVLLDVELTGILETCRKAWLETDGFFDIAVNREEDANFGAIDFDPDTRLIFFRNVNARLDFGGFGKGYALDCAARLLRECGVKQALLHGGTSSVLAIGNDANEQPWRIGLRDPWKDDVVLQQVDLSDNALSTSATGKTVSDILDPFQRQPLQEKASCTVIAESAAQAEVFSTALLCMGKDKVASFVSPEIKALWTAESPSPKIILL